jgi:hypothetical protein
MAIHEGDAQESILHQPGFGPVEVPDEKFKSGSDATGGFISGNIPGVWQARAQMTIDELVAAADMSLNYVTEEVIEYGAAKDTLSPLAWLELTRARWYMSRADLLREALRAERRRNEDVAVGEVPADWRERTMQNVERVHQATLAPEPPMTPGPLGEFEEVGAKMPPLKEAPVFNVNVYGGVEVPTNSLINQPDHRERRPIGRPIRDNPQA